MNQIDQAKLVIILNDTTKRLTLLDRISQTVTDDISSELAGWEISKLLEQQYKLENKYAELVLKRTSLTGIEKKPKLLETQEEVKEVAKMLKDSTKKLTRLFKENPDIEKDAQKVKLDRSQLKEILEDLIELTSQNGGFNKFQQKTTQELENQDQLRRLIQTEKELNQEIKRLTQEQQKEFRDYQIEQQEKNEKIQKLKEELMEKKSQAKLSREYDEKNKRAAADSKIRMQEYQQKLELNKIHELEQKRKTEQQVHEQLRMYLENKEREIKRESEEWANKTRLNGERLDEEISALEEEKQRRLVELEELRTRKQKEALAQKEQEEKELQEIEERKQKELQQIRKDNAIKLIQNEFLEWKEAGGGKKKKKKKKKKA